MNDPRASNAATDAVDHQASRAQPPGPPRRPRARPWLLLLMLAALIGLLTQRPALTAQALAFAGDGLLHGLNISPRDVYALRLRVAGLDDSALGRRWAHAVDRAEPRPFTTRHATRDRFAADAITAHVYAITLQRGERLDIRLVRDARCAACGGRLYASLEHRASDSHDATDWSRVATLDTGGRTERHVPDRDGDYRVVLQPELGARLGYRIAMARGGSLAFPVQGASRRAIGSGFGAPRDGGSRSHHGVDIFADRGTPVRAVAGGRIRTGTGGIGGKHVWLSTNSLGIGGARYYYAHLDDFAVGSGARVATGDLIGHVGNTGNARTTPPHLHFGIYTASGPVDPAPFIGPPPRLADN